MDATTLARAYYHLHRWEQAAAIFDSLVPRPGADIADFTDATVRTVGAIVAARVGRPQTARDISTALKSFGQGSAGTAFMRARIAAAIGDRDVAIALLRTALEGGLPHMRLHTSTQDFELLWDDPEYRALVGPQDKRE